MKHNVKTKYYWSYLGQTPNDILMGRLYYKIINNRPKFLRGYACIYRADGISITVEVSVYEKEY